MGKLFSILGFKKQKSSKLIQVKKELIRKMFNRIDGNAKKLKSPNSQVCPEHTSYVPMSRF